MTLSLRITRSAYVDVVYARKGITHPKQFDGEAHDAYIQTFCLELM